MQPTSLYLHIPFCRHRCGYCDFNTYAGLDSLIPAYTDALIAEAEWLGRAAQEAGGQRLPVHTIFLGGGTPSLLPLDGMQRLLAALHAAYDVAADAEISLEANPGTLSPEYLAGLRAAGFNRLSLGVQSASPHELIVLEREHDFADVINSVKWARQAGFENLNLDWIFGLPGQSLASWQRNLELAVSLAPEHLSLYALSIEHGTPFKELDARGLLALPDGDLAAEMYELADSELAAAGFVQYEISNWAKPGPDGKLLACRHNLQYWRNLPYAGLGAGAHGFLAGHRTANVLAPAAYIKRMREAVAVQAAKLPTLPRTPATASAEQVDVEREMGETMMMGLRLVHEGVSTEGFAQRFGSTLEQVYGKSISTLQRRGLLETAAGTLRLTQQGRLLGNQVFMEFV
ncbi:MAG TPA: radical SAM family heme chaperone HemW [Anaerolineales bacterium]|nr:radical SAM family heme chaperone HemW [Anaerolineales bacterium]HRQ91327.1 radical SAM family heme chaperone HemW [Anaerolineales bacterium]